MKLKIILLLLIFIFSRVIFVNPLPIFFDSPEYLERFSNPNYFQAIASGHMPYHAPYIMLFWPIFHIALFFKINPSFTIIFAQIIFSAIAMYCFYRFIEIIANKKIALIATIIGSSFPLYWITNISIMTESIYINFFIISLYLLVKRRIFFGSLSFGLALLTNPLVILWSPFLLFTIYFSKKETISKVLLAIIITTALSILINSSLVAKVLQTSLLNGIQNYLLGEDLHILPDVSSLFMILRFLRNAFMPILQNNTAFILPIAIISFMKIFKINKKLFFATALWVLPIIIVNQWFNPLLSGRHGIISEFGLAFLAAIFLEKRKKLFLLAFVYLLITYLPALSLLKQPIPYIEEQKFVSSLPKGLLIESHFARPQIEGHYSGNIIFVNEPGWSKKKLKETINMYMQANKPIYITSQALSDPYGLYTGPFLHPLSLSYTKSFELKDTMQSYTIKKYATIDSDAGLIVYRIVSKNKSKYPNISKLNYNRHQVNYFDPVIHLWFLAERAIIIQSHNIIKE